MSANALPLQFYNNNKIGFTFSVFKAGWPYSRLSGLTRSLSVFIARLISLPRMQRTEGVGCLSMCVDAWCEQIAHNFRRKKVCWTE